MNKISIDTLRNGQSQSESELEMITALQKYLDLNLEFWDGNDLDHWQSSWFPELVEQTVKFALDKQKEDKGETGG